MGNVNKTAATPQRAHGKALGGLILGIISFILTVISIVFAVIVSGSGAAGTVGIICSLAAFICSIPGWLLSIYARSADESDVRAKIGDVCSSIGLIGGMAAFIYILAMVQKSGALLSLIATLIWLVFWIGYAILSKREYKTMDKNEERIKAGTKPGHASAF